MIIMPSNFDLSNLQGLSDQEVIENLAMDGYNELPSAKKRSFLKIVFEVMKEPMFLLLIACGVLYLFLGDLEEALMLLGFVFVVMGITLYQEQKTERALDALRDLSSPRALVIRNGLQQRIPGREVVRDDIILVSEGDRVPADAVLLTGTNISVDESLLTGESVPVRKINWDGLREVGRPGGDDLPFIYSGSMVVKGQGIARVLSTGLQTEIGKIGKALQTLEQEHTNLQRQTARIVKIFAMVGLSLCAIVVIVFGLTRGDWLEGFLAGITLAMATLPEEFPVVLTIFMALGAWRISKQHVLTRRMPAVEMLGAATALCVDKTGTLTLNHMTVTKISSGDHLFDIDGKQSSLPKELHAVVEYSLLASPADPFDPMEKAMKELGGRTLLNTGHIHQDWALVHEYPLSEKLLAMSRVWRSPDGQDYIIASKGAPEAIADLCHFDSAKNEMLLAQINRMADQGLRVIGVAQATFRHMNLPKGQHDFDFQFLGLLGLADPVRPGVREALQECYTAGIRVIMITGDYPGTARNIASQIGLHPDDQIITGPELDGMTDDVLKERIKTVCIFARAVPEQKLRIVMALKANNEVVAMTGDGVNDAPALKAAHIGIAMGGRGTDVARESAALVLLDDNFASIVQAVHMGRRIYDNLKKAMAFIFSIHVPIAGMSLIPVLLKWPLALLPVQIVLLELIIDPSCSVVFEMESDETNIMNRKPRRLEEPLFGPEMIRTGLIQGLGVLAVVCGVYAFMLLRGYGEQQARMLAFLNMVIADLALVFANRSWTRSFLQLVRVPNPALWWVVGGALSLLILTQVVPFLRELMKFAILPSWEYTMLLVTGALILAIAEFAKPKYWNRKI